MAVELKFKKQYDNADMILTLPAVGLNNIKVEKILEFPEYYLKKYDLDFLFSNPKEEIEAVKAMTYEELHQMRK